MRYKVTVGNLGIAEANQIIRICSQKGLGIPEIEENPEVFSTRQLPVLTHEPKFRRKEIVVTAVAPDGSSQTGNSLEVAEFIHGKTGTGVSASNMMQHFRAGRKYRDFTGVIVADSRRIRKGATPPVSIPMPDNTPDLYRQQVAQ